MIKTWDVLGFGAVAVDDLLYVEAYPPPNTKAEVVAEQRQGGGLTGTALVAAARLGARTAYAGVLGTDELSTYTIQALEREGVDCAPLLRRAGAEPIHSRIIVERRSGNRVILFNISRVIWRAPHEISEEVIGPCRVLFVDHYDLEGHLRAVEIAHRCGIPVVGDVERATGESFEEYVAQLDHLIVSRDMALQYTGQSDLAAAARALGGPQRACACVTDGECGCWYTEHGGEVQYMPAFAVHTVDTTGCGDVFHGAYAAMLAQGESIATAILVASATAALKATQPGGRIGIPRLEAVKRFLLERTGAEPCRT